MPRSLRRGVLLQFGLGREAVAVAEDGGDGERATALQEGDLAVVLGERALDLGGVPAGGVADIGNGHVVMLAPEEGHGIEALAAAEDVARRRLALALGDHPVL